MTRRPCPDCDGYGYERVYDSVTSSNRSYPCPRCDGSGQIGVTRAEEQK